MKTEFKAKFLQHVAKKRKEEGFTLIELLVVIIIIGILSAIALPSFLNQANKAKQSEAKTYIGSLNKGQQAFYAENNTFTTDIDALGVGIKTQTTNYVYTCTGSTNAGATCYGQSTNTQSLRSYGGSVYFLTTSATGDATTSSLLCETDGPNTFPNLTVGASACPANTQLVK
ncbi:MAG: type IV pilin-like G/H family protein [Microcoleaceae cyanobacterium]